MKSSDETIGHLALRIGYVYYDPKPRLYGGDGAGIDLLLHTYHSTWAFITSRTPEFQAAWRGVMDEEECGSAGFPTRYAMNHPEASEDEISAYTVAQWKKVTERLGVPLPHTQLEDEFAVRPEPRSNQPTGGPEWVNKIEYHWSPGLGATEFIDLLERSTLAERRPVDDREMIEGMLVNAGVIATARNADGLLVGVARSITDYFYCTYLSDLAVDAAYQGRGIGRELIRMTHEWAGLNTMLILLSAPNAQTYYPHIGMRRHDSCWVIDRQAKPTGEI